MQRDTINEERNFAVVSDMHRDPCKLYGAPTFSAIRQFLGLLRVNLPAYVN